MKTFEIESDLDLAPAAAWSHATSPRGVNEEFWPILRMTFPATVQDITADWSPGRRLFRSWILLFGLLPVEYDDIGMQEVEPGARFLEVSRMFSQREWRHERIVLETSSGSRLIDRVSFTSKVAWLEPIQLPVFRTLFRYRHWRLRRLHGSGAD